MTEQLRKEAQQHVLKAREIGNTSKLEIDKQLDEAERKIGLIKPDVDVGAVKITVEPNRIAVPLISTSDNHWKLAFGEKYKNGEPHGQVISDGTLFQTLEPRPQGSTRHHAEGYLPDAKGVIIRQSVKFHKNFEWVRGGKFGFDIAGGNNMGGGNTSGDGFIFRLMWREDGRIVLYSYHANREFNNGGTWGMDLDTGFVAERDVWIHFITTFGFNSPGNADGSIHSTIYTQNPVDDTGHRVHEGIQFQSEGIAGTNLRMLYQSFYGGQDPSWAPENSNTIMIRDVSYELIR